MMMMVMTMMMMNLPFLEGKMQHSVGFDARSCGDNEVVVEESHSCCNIMMDPLIIPIGQIRVDGHY